MSHLIVPCNDRSKSPPPTVRQLGTKRALGREVIGWTEHAGTYGNGGPGFFGLQLSASNDLPSEWLILRLWGAACWLLLDGRWVVAHPDWHSQQKPLFNNFNGQLWDGVSEKLIGTRIVSMCIEDDSSTILMRGGSEVVLEIPLDTLLLSYRFHPVGPRLWSKDESQLDAWVYATSAELWV